MRELSWDKPHYILDGEIFLPSIYDGDPDKGVPSGFNTVTLVLDGRMKSDLNWESMQKKALDYIQNGFFLFWEMELGLSEVLTLPLQNQTQFAALSLSLDQFRNGLGSQFSENTVGLSLYRGSAANLLRHGDIDTVVEFLNLLTINMPDKLQLFLQLDFEGIEKEKAIYILSKERFDRWHCAVKGLELPSDELTWDKPSPFGYISKAIFPGQEKVNSAIAICLPPVDLPFDHYHCELKKVLDEFQASNKTFKIIPESFLITEWDGLDYLVVFTNCLGPQGKRKLQGFCAAGGTVVTVGSELGLPVEISYHQFLSNLL